PGPCQEPVPPCTTYPSPCLQQQPPRYPPTAPPRETARRRAHAGGPARPPPARRRPARRQSAPHRTGRRRGAPREACAGMVDVEVTSILRPWRLVEGRPNVHAPPPSSTNLEFPHTSQ